MNHRFRAQSFWSLGLSVSRPKTELDVCPYSLFPLKASLVSLSITDSQTPQFKDFIDALARYSEGYQVNMVRISSWNAFWYGFA